MHATQTHNFRQRIAQAGLPRNHKVHWSDAKKAEVVRAVRDRLITFDEARWNYLLSRSEFETWQRQFAKQGTSKADRAKPDNAREMELA